jgi:hypothetical protein
MEETAHTTAEHHEPANGHAHEPEAAFPPAPETAEEAEDNKDLAAKVATIAVVGVGAALISVELIPGMLLGVAAAFLPGVRNKVKPFFRHTVKAGYSAMRKTREMMAEAGEQFQDIVAEAKSEKVVTPPVAKV